jgi:hypothetical protein
MVPVTKNLHVFRAFLTFIKAPQKSHPRTKPAFYSLSIACFAELSFSRFASVSDWKRFDVHRALRDASSISLPPELPP